MLDVLKGMRRVVGGIVCCRWAEVVLCMLEVCSTCRTMLCVLELLKGVRCVPLCMLEAVEVVAPRDGG
jgi:hypothetical protein